ncbi:hypothetical protein CRYUN_Cryun29cG0011800 [Craigia yunnanensis]
MGNSPGKPRKALENPQEEDHNFSFTCEICIEPTLPSKIQEHQHLQAPFLPGLPTISASLFSTWCDLLCEDSLLGSERSYCPNSNCLALVLNECGGNVKKSKCPNCKQLFCFQCQTVWHAGYQCEESEQIRDRNDFLFGQLIERKKWTRCPGCGQCVERLLGCSVVKCRLRCDSGSIKLISSVLVLVTSLEWVESSKSLFRI